MPKAKSPGGSPAKARNAEPVGQKKTKASVKANKKAKALDASKSISNTQESPLKFADTSKIAVSARIIEQVIGQEEAVNVIKKAASQRRHVLLIGEPGTGKSMLGLALAELLPKEKLVDVLSFPNANDENQPLIRTVPSGKGRDIVMRARLESMGLLKNQNMLMFILAVVAMIIPWWIRSHYKSDIMFAAFFLGGMLFLAIFAMFIN